MVTGQQMCEYIIEVFPDMGVKAEDIWNASPTGELSHVFELYWAARCKAENKKLSIDSLGFITLVPL